MNFTRSERALGIDFGSTRIGLALSDPGGTIATGYKTVRFGASVYEELAEIVKEKDVAVVVVGLPVSLKGGDSRKTKEVRRFTAELEKILTVPVVLQDERFTSQNAMATMIAMDTTKKQRRDKGRIDEMAAALILQSYLDTKRKRQREANHGRK